MISKKLSGLDTLDVKAKKKKNIIIIIGIVGALSFIVISVGSAFLSVDRSKVYKERKEIDANKDLKIIQNPEMKESWAMSVDNRLKEQEKKTAQVVEEIGMKQDSVLDELKLLLKENSAKTEENFQIFSATVDAKISQLKKNLNSKINDQESRMEAIALKGNQNRGEDGDIVLNKDLLPVVNKKKKELDPAPEESLYETKKSEVLDSKKDLPTPKLADLGDTKTDTKNASKKKLMKLIEIDTSFNKGIVTAQSEINNDYDQEEENNKDKSNNSYHISTGMSQAYMITGAYAPAFQEGESEPLPVLLETEGQIIMPNNNRGTIEKCFLLGSAKGNMNSQTASIKLVSISCLLNGGTHRIEGPISGWVIGENGIPGIHGEMLHKNGAWLARTFVSGFLETFATALGRVQGGQISIGGTTGGGSAQAGLSTGSQISNNLTSAGASGVSTVFNKLGEYYLKMAEQIFPIIEVKGGRTIDILLVGGEELSVVENNKVDIGAMQSNIDKANLNKSSKKNTMSKANAFTKTITKTGDSKASSVPAKN